MNFIAFSNIQQEALQKIFELDINALTCPSVQIRKFPDSYKELESLKDDSSFNAFGDISFVFSQQNIFGQHNTIPKNDATHQIYAGDAYTLRFPEITFSVDIKKRNEFIKEVSSVYDLDNVKEYIHDNFDFEIQRKHKDKYKIKEKLLNSISIKFLFLKEAGLLENFKIIQDKDKKLTTYTENDDELKELLKKTNTLTVRNNKEKYIDFINKKHDLIQDEDEKEVWKLLCYDREGNPDPIAFFKVFQKDINIIKNKSKENSKTNKEKTNKLLERLLKKSEKILNTKFEDFLEYHLQNIFHSPKIKENNKPLTAENIVAYMKRQRGAGAEQGHIYSYNRASVDNQNTIRSYEDMVDNSDYLLEGQDFEKYEELIKNKIFKIGQKVNAYDEEFIKKITKLGRNPSLESIKNQFKNTEVDIEVPILMLDIQELCKLNNNRKHLYFEAKPNKAFYFHNRAYEDQKLTHIIVPNDIDEKLLKNLEKTNLKIIKYNAKTENSLSRLKALYQCRELFINNDNKRKINRKNKP